MKKIIFALSAVLVLGAAVLAFAHGPGMGHGGRMMGMGCDGMMGSGTGMCAMMSDQKFLDETADLRKQLHDKKFEYFEAVRDPQTPSETLSGLEDEITALRGKISEKVPQAATQGCRGCGCW